MRIRQGTLNYIEDELIHYHETVREIDKMRNEILHSGRSSLGGEEGGRSSMPSDPTARVAIELSSNNRIVRMEQIVISIRSVVDKLDHDRMRLVQIMYWDRPRKYTWVGAAMVLHINRSTAYRWRREILVSIAKRGGFY